MVEGSRLFLERGSVWKWVPSTTLIHPAGMQDESSLLQQEEDKRATSRCVCHGIRIKPHGGIFDWKRFLFWTSADSITS